MVKTKIIRTEEDFKKVTHLVNGDLYEFVRMLEDAELDSITDSDDVNYLYYRVSGKLIDALSGEATEIFHDINGKFSVFSIDTFDLVFPNDL